MYSLLRSLRNCEKAVRGLGTDHVALTYTCTLRMPPIAGLWGSYDIRGMILLCNLALLRERLYGALHGRMGGLKIRLRAHAGISIHACCQDCRHQFRVATPLVYSVLAGLVGAPSLSHGSAWSGPTTAAKWRTQAFGAVGFAMRHGSNPSYDCAALADRPLVSSGGDTGAAA